MGMWKKKYTGWSIRQRPFTPKEFSKAHIAKDFNKSYSAYLREFARQYKSKKSRSSLLKG